MSSKEGQILTDPGWVQGSNDRAAAKAQKIMDKEAAKPVKALSSRKKKSRKSLRKTSADSYFSGDRSFV